MRARGCWRDGGGKTSVALVATHRLCRRSSSAPPLRARRPAVESHCRLYTCTCTCTWKICECTRMQSIDSSHPWPDTSFDIYLGGQDAPAAGWRRGGCGRAVVSGASPGATREPQWCRPTCVSARVVTPLAPGWPTQCKAVASVFSPIPSRAIFRSRAVPRRCVRCKLLAWGSTPLYGAAGAARWLLALPRAHMPARDHGASPPSPPLPSQPPPSPPPHLQYSYGLN